MCPGLDASTIRHPGRASRKNARGYASTGSPSVKGAIKITRAGSGSSAGLIDFDGIGSMRDLR
jgi:hypothetical protein